MMFDVTWLNIASGNWRSMKSEMLGKILSDVSGELEVSAAVAKELKATSTMQA
jgi:hypothetical protein